MSKIEKINSGNEAGIQKERTLSDAEKIKNGANYVQDSRLEFEKEQVESARLEMEKELLVKKLKEAVKLTPENQEKATKLFQIETEIRNLKKEEDAIFEVLSSQGLAIEFDVYGGDVEISPEVAKRIGFDVNVFKPEKIEDFTGFNRKGYKKEIVENFLKELGYKKLRGENHFDEDTEVETEAWVKTS